MRGVSEPSLMRVRASGVGRATEQNNVGAHGDIFVEGR